MAKDLRTFIADLRRESPHEVVEINKVVDPANYDISAIIKHLDDQKKFPVLIFNKALGLNGKVSPVRVCMNAEISQNKIQIALGVPRTMTRAQMGDECLKREAKPLKPVVIAKTEAPVKEVVQTGAAADLYELPVLRHAEMDGGPYIVMASAVKDMKTGIYNTSYHRMEVKGPQLTALYTSPRHLWRIFTEYEKAGKECPVVTILAHHPCFNMGAAYKGSLDTDEYDIIGGYMKEPLRMTASETWGDDFLVPADAEVDRGRRAGAQRAPGGRALSARPPAILARSATAMRSATRCGPSRGGRTPWCSPSSRLRATSRGWTCRARPHTCAAAARPSPRSPPCARAGATRTTTSSSP